MVSIRRNSKIQPEHFDMIEQICSESNNGYGFVPLIGSGMSVVSGIPTIQETQKYLYLCLRLALDKKWKPRSSKWYKIEHLKEEVARSIVEGKHESVLLWIQKEVDRLNKKTSLDHSDYIHWEATGALADWRTTLQFLSRLEIYDDKIFLGKPDNRVIDSFFFHITKDKKPNVGHLMLGHLADALRINTLLTTNFDSLVEEAFAQLDMPLSTFDVHQNAELPTPGLVLPQRSIIKLHGGRYGLRANFTLDEIPSDYDKETFCRYFSDKIGGKFEGTRKHLLVLGASGSDRRIINLIQFALENVPELKVFWICHTKREKKTNSEKFPKHAEQVKTAVHVDNGQFLIQLYHQLYLSPPPGRVDFPAFWPIHPSSYENVEKSVIEKFKKEQKKVSDKVNTVLETPDKPGLILYGQAGITSLAAKIAEILAENNEFIWLTLNFYHGWNDFFLTLIDTISWRLGIPPATLPTSVNNSEACYKRLNHLLRHTSRNFIVFLNDREGEGIQNSMKWKKSLELFQDVIIRINSKIANLIFILLAPQEKEREVILAYGESYLLHNVKHNVIEYEANNIADNVVKFIKMDSREETEEQKVHFVYTLTLFEHAAYLPALCSWSLIKAPYPFTDIKDNDKERSTLRDKWLEELKNIGAIRYNAGGFVWMHKGVRDELRKRLSNKMMRYRAECHQGIADWYVKLFRSSNDPLAALESLKHRLHCIEYADDLGNDAGCGSRDYLKRTSLIEARVTLMLAKERLLSCGYYNTAISRIKQIMEQIEKEFKDKENPLYSHENEINRFKRTCNELLRDFHREVAEFPDAIKYNEKVNSLSPARDGQSGLKLDNIRERYEKIVYLIGYRCYEEAESEIFELFDALHIKHFLDKEVHNGSDNLTSVEYRQIARDWIEQETPSLKILQCVIRSLRRLMFLEMLIAQKYQLLSEVEEENENFREYSNKRLLFLKRSEIVYVFTTELMRNLDDPDFLQTENAYIRTHYGVLLGNLGRFFEAHRRLNEAYGYLTQSSKRNSPTPWAVLYLRRAEVYLKQAQFCDPESTEEKVKRKIQVYLNDAYCSLEQAERYLKGFRKNIWWWTWMYELKVSVCVLLAKIHRQCPQRHYITRGQHEPFACSRCAFEGQRCFELLQESMELIQFDPLRQAKLTFLFSDFLSNIKLNGMEGCIRLLKDALERSVLLLKIRERNDNYPLGSGLGDYVNAVISRVWKQVSNLETEQSPLSSTKTPSHIPKPPSKTRPERKQKIQEIPPDRKSEGHSGDKSFKDAKE